MTLGPGNPFSALHSAALGGRPVRSRKRCRAPTICSGLHFSPLIGGAAYLASSSGSTGVSGSARHPQAARRSDAARRGSRAHGPAASGAGRRAGGARRHAAPRAARGPRSPDAGSVGRDAGSVRADRHLPRRTWRGYPSAPMPRIRPGPQSTGQTCNDVQLARRSKSASAWRTATPSRIAWAAIRQSISLRTVSPRRRQVR